jgi:hypothetical protein
MRFPRTVTASTMIARFELRRKVRCHSGDVEVWKVRCVVRIGGDRRNASAPR